MNEHQGDDFQAWAHEQAPFSLQWLVGLVTPISSIVGL